MSLSALDLLRDLTKAALDVSTGISVHNALSPDAPARREDIKGPVITALNAAACEARNWLASDAARAEGVAALQQAGEPVEFEASIRPPPHWPSNPDYDRHPQTAEEWDWRTHRGVDIAIKRLNFAGDLADPRAPDQMALVLRTDLITLKHDWIWKNAVFEEWREERASLPQQTALVEQGVEKIIGPHEPAACGEGTLPSPSEPPRSAGGEA